MVERLYVLAHLAVAVIPEQQPVELLVLVPLDELGELLAHEQQLFAGVGHHVAVEHAQAGEFLLVVAGHFVDEAALAVHHLVVAERQDEILAEGVEEAERHLVVVARAEQRVGAHVAEHVVHPAHVPLEVEAQAPVAHRMGDHRPRRALLGDHQRVRMAREHLGVQLLQKGDGPRGSPCRRFCWGSTRRRGGCNRGRACWPRRPRANRPHGTPRARTARSRSRSSALRRGRSRTPSCPTPCARRAGGSGPHSSWCRRICTGRTGPSGSGRAPSP